MQRNNPFNRSVRSLFLTGSLLFLSSALLQAEILSPDQIKKIISELNRMEGIVTGKRLEGRRNAVEAFRRASASEKDAYEFYLACAKELEFDQQGKSSTDFRSWKEGQETKLKTPSRMAVMRLQLQYLVLTLRVAEGESALKVLPEVEAFLAGIVSNAAALEGDLGILQKENVLATPFAKLYELDQSIKLTDWGYQAGSIGQIYDKFVLPTLRIEHPELLGAAWDRRIQLETQLAQITKKDDAVALEKFANENLPRMQWRRAEDLFKVGQQQEASLAMLKLLTDHAEHADASEWINGFRKLLVPPDPAP